MIHQPSPFDADELGVDCIAFSTLAQMAIAWVLRDARVTSALIGARKVAQLDDSLDALKKMAFSDEELKQIDGYATEGGVDLWRGFSGMIRLRDR